MLLKNQLLFLDKAYKWLKTRKNLIMVLVATIFVSIGIFSVTVFATGEGRTEESNLIEAYFTYLDGKDIGIVGDKEDIDGITEKIRQDYETRFHMETILTNRIEYEKIHISDQFLSDLADLEKIIKVNSKALVKVVHLKVEGREFGILKDMDTANAILDSLKEPYRIEAQEMDRELLSVGFEEDVTLEEAYMEYEKLNMPEEVTERLTQAKEEKQVYIVEAGDNVWLIAEKHNMSVWDVLDANAPMEESDIIQIGQELNLNLPELALNILVEEKTEYTRSVPYETETKKSSSMYTTEIKVSQAGQKGESDVVAKVYKRNGIETEREIISETVIKEPVTEIITVGTKIPPKGSSSSRGGGNSGGGSLSWPISGRITSRFGWRGSPFNRMHNGIDIASSKGTPIYAAKDGTVSFSGYSGSYGNLIKIKHGGGLETYYAHMSSRVAKQGQSVKRGQLIGYVGSTGNSTGPHLHFEVRLNGSPKNPLSYLR